MKNSIESKINAILAEYGDKAPAMTILDNCGAKVITLDGGHYSARQDVEDYLTEANLLAEVSNQPNSKTLTIAR